MLSDIRCRMLRTVLTNRILRFLHDKSRKEAESYNTFYRDYGIFLKEGIISSNDQREKVIASFHSFCYPRFSLGVVSIFPALHFVGRDLEIVEVRIIDAAPW